MTSCHHDTKKGLRALPVLGLGLRFTGARKRTGKKNKKEKNQEKISVTRVDTIGDAAELLSPNLIIENNGGKGPGENLF